MFCLGLSRFFEAVNVPNTIDKGKIEKDFFLKYKKALKAKTQQYKKLLQKKDIEIKEKDSEIIQLHREKSTDLMRIIELQAQQTINVEAKAMAGDTYHQNQVGIGHISGGKIEKEVKIAGIINEAQEKTLAEATKEIQDLLQQLEKSYPSTTPLEQIALAGEAVKAIENNPTLKQRLINAGKEGGLAFVEKACDNVVGATISASIRGWIEAEN